MFHRYDTTSLTSTFLAYELALNPDIQERLRDEINEVLEKYEEEICHDSIAEMKYLDMVLNEASSIKKLNAAENFLHSPFRCTFMSSFFAN